MATLVHCSGFEQGSTAGINVGQNSARYVDRVVGALGSIVEVVSAAARTGSFGARITTTAQIGHIGWQNNGNGGVLGAAGTLVASFYFRFPTLPGGNYNIFIDIGTAGGNDFTLRYLTSGTRLQAEFGANTQLGPVVAANTWYRVDLSIVHDANPHVAKWQIDGVAQTDVTLAVASENIFIAGFGQDNANSTGVLHVDDVLLSLTAGDYPLGPHKVLQLIPDTAATATEIGTANATGRMVTNSAIDATFNSANILAAISEVPPLTGGTATGLGQRTLSTASACNIPMTTYSLAAGESILGMRVNACTWAANATVAANTLGVRAFNGTAETTLYPAFAYLGQNTASPSWICKMYTGVTNQTTLDALAVRIGYSGDVTPLPGVHAVYAEVAVVESAAGVGGDALLQTGPATISTAVRNATATGLGQTGTQTLSTGSKTETASGRAAVRSQTSSAGLKAQTGSGTVPTQAVSGTAGAKTSTGATAAQTGTSTLTAGSRSVAGSAVAAAGPVSSSTGSAAAPKPGIASQRSATTSAGFKSAVSSTAPEAQRSATGATATKTAAGAATAVQETSARTTVIKTGAGAGLMQQGTQSTGTGTRSSSGTGITVVRSSTLGSGTRAATGTGAASAQSVQTSASSQPTGNAFASTRAVTRSSGTRGSTGAAAATCRTSNRSAGSKTAITGGLAATRSASASSGIHKGAGASLSPVCTNTRAGASRGATGQGTASQRCSSGSTVRRGGVGAGRTAQRSTTAAVHLTGQTGLRIRIRGREPNLSTAGRENDSTVTGREPDLSVSARGNDTMVSGRENDTTITGREQGTL